MGVRDRFLRGLAAQLGRPEGVRGRLVARRLNRDNRSAVIAAVQATQLEPGQVAADIGFGGGGGLGLLLARVRPDGHVHGVDLSDTMLKRARRTFRTEGGNGELSLTLGSITALPLTDESLDAAITVNTIYFVTDLERACTELARVLRPAAPAVVGLGDPETMARTPVTAHGFTLRPVADVIATLGKAGLTTEDHLRVGGGDSAFHLLVARKSVEHHVQGAAG